MTMLHAAIPKYLSNNEVKNRSQELTSASLLTPAHV